MLWCRFEINGRPSYGIVEGENVIEVAGEPFSRYERRREDGLAHVETLALTRHSSAAVKSAGTALTQDRL